MKRTRIQDILARGEAGQAVTLGAWVRTKRVSKGFAFVVLNDGSSQDNLQCVVEGETDAFHALDDVTTGSAVKVVGELKESPGKGQAFEVAVQTLDVVGQADATTYPLQKKGHTLEFLREIGHLRPRTNTLGAVFRVRNALAYGVHQFFQGRGFQWVHTPLITASDCEGAGEMFTVTTLDMAKPPKDDKGNVDWKEDFFGKQTYLTVSGQLEAEFLALSMGDVYTFGPTFRAENSNTARHLAEFWMIEPEMAFADLDADIDLAQDFFRHMCKVAVETCPAELAFLEKMYKTIKVDEIAKLSEAKFARMSYTDAVKTLQESGKKFEFPVEWGNDLQSEHERYLTDEVHKGPVVVTDYPKTIKPFYMRCNDDDKTVAAMDVLAPRIGEIIGGSQREERLDVLTDRMTAQGLELDHMQWYTDLRRYGSVPHAGFGLGFERIVQYLTGMGNIRDVIPCPRAPKTIGI